MYIDTLIEEISEVKISYIKKGNNKIKLQSSTNAYNLVYPFFEEHINYKESFGVLLLSRSNSVLGFRMIGVGTTTGCAVNVKEILQMALLSNCSGVIVIHNHPSGNKKPSDSDISLTAKIKNGLLLFDCSLLDHLILCENDYLSFADENLI